MVETRSLCKILVTKTYETGYEKDSDPQKDVSMSGLVSHHLYSDP
jgi:hypothetical protein